MGKTNTGNTIIGDENGEQLSDGKDRLARWKRHFEGVLNMSSSVAVDSNICLTSTEQTDGNGDLRELTMEEVRKAVKRLKNGKAGGGDGIVAELLKYGGERSN